MDLKSEVLKINKELSSKGISLRLERRGDSLNIRGPLPSKKNNGVNSIQRVSLGLPAEAESLIEAEKTLEIIDYQIKHHQFNWDNWIIKSQKSDVEIKRKTIDEGIKSFKHNFFCELGKSKSHAGRRTTWSSAYLPYLRKLSRLADAQTEYFDISLLSRTLNSYAENSRSRQQCGVALGALAEYLQIKLPEKWQSQANGYGLHQASFRNLPADHLIKKYWEKIPNPKWRLAYGLMATYGIRNHEVFFCDATNLTKKGNRILRVLPNTKTGEHESWPFHPEWFDLFELHKLGQDSNNLPNVKTDLNQTTLQQVGRRVAEQFKRYRVPITPYDLRHAWAVRTIHVGLPDTVSARMMGHSVSIHTKTYHHWITRRDQQRAVDAALSKTS